MLFITGYSYLTMGSKRVLDNVAETLKKESFSFVIQGHVCCTEGESDAVDRKTNKKIYLSQEQNSFMIFFWKKVFPKKECHTKV